MRNGDTVNKPHARLAPLADSWNWQQQALCRDIDSSVFFHPDGERGLARARRVSEAKALCARCPVRQECREHALAAEESYGIWGGLSERELADAREIRPQESLPPIAG